MMKQLFDPLFIPDKGEITEDLLSYENIQIKRIVSSAFGAEVVAEIPPTPRLPVLRRSMLRQVCHLPVYLM